MSKKASFDDAWVNLVASLIQFAINSAAVWFLWDAYLTGILKGIPQIDFWAALTIVAIGNFLCSPYRSKR